jgi:hypothetical protein
LGDLRDYIVKRAARERNWPSAYRNDTNVKADTHKSPRQRTSGGRRSPAAVLCEFRNIASIVSLAMTTDTQGRPVARVCPVARSRGHARP